MPVYTNRHNLPAPLARALAYDGYSKGEANASVTELIGSPRIAILKARHADEITIDVMDRVWSALGTAFHSILEGHAAETEGFTPEERIFAEIGGWLISGGVDIQEDHAGGLSLLDWKTCSTWAVQNEKRDWHAQTNLYALLIKLAKPDARVTRLQIGAVMRDWKQSEAERNNYYPQAPIQMIDIPLWPMAELQAYAEERVRLHQEARRAAEWGEELPLCTAEEMWERGGAWAVSKAGAKRALRVFEDEQIATKFAQAEQDRVLSHRPGERIRCSKYCEVAAFCDQFREYCEGKND